MSALQNARIERALRDSLKVYQGLTLKGQILEAWRAGRIPDDRAQLLLEQFGLEVIETVVVGTE